MTLLPTVLCSQQETFKKALKTKVLGSRSSGLGRGPLSSQNPHHKPLLLTNALWLPRLRKGTVLGWLDFQGMLYHSL